MKDLKDSLMESFVKPLKFKFMVEKLTLIQPSPLEEKISENKIENEKIKIYKAIYEEYQKFKITIPT